MSTYDMQSIIKNMRRLNPWLLKVDSQAIRYMAFQVNYAYQGFFRRVKTGQNPGFPQYKTKKRPDNRYTSTCPSAMKIEEKKIKIPRVGWVKARGVQIPRGKIKRVTISQAPSGKYYASFLIDEDVCTLSPTESIIGIDLGVKDFIIDSNGVHYQNPKYLFRLGKKLKREVDSLYRKQCGSHNWEKQRVKVAKIHERIANQRNDFHHKISTKLIRENQVICVEDLNVERMMKTKGIAKYVSDVGFAAFIEMLKYKSSWYGRSLAELPPYYPSSQLCSNCGYQNHNVRDLAVRFWTCPQCGVSHERDENAAKNILHKGMEIYQTQIVA